jgi:CheY-like chemotaxis protein
MFADPIRLQQILWNLITNAIKFSPDGSKVLVKLNRVQSVSGDIIQFQVSDNGKGIKPDFLPFVFERFTQVDSTSTRAYGGLGLGLAIVRKLVEMHMGTISVESLGDNRGSTFTVSLPAKPELPSQKPVNRTHDYSEADLSGLKILLVDDEEPAREVFCLLLEAFNAEVKTAGSASEALAVFKDFRPNVLVSDIAMPVEDGYSLIAKIRALNPTVPALALSAYAGQDEINRMLAAGFHAHVAKPVDAGKLARSIADLVGRK